MTTLELNKIALAEEKEKIENACWELNGNNLVESSHIFKYGEGCYFDSVDSARKNTRLANKVGIEILTQEFQGKTWYKYSFSNTWD